MNDQTVLVWLLIEQEDAVLLALRKPETSPFGGQWALPGDGLEAEESASETLSRVGREQLDVTVRGEEFVDTLYLQEGGVEYAVNVFRVTSFLGKLRFRESGPYADIRWALRNEVPELTGLPPGLGTLITNSKAS